MNTKNTTTYAEGNSGTCFRQACTCGGSKPVIGSLLYAVFIVSMVLLDKAIGAIFKLYQVSFQLDDGGFRFVLDKHD